MTKILPIPKNNRGTALFFLIHCLALFHPIAWAAVPGITPPKTTAPLSRTGHPETNRYITVRKVYDGDTVLLENGEKVRLSGINTPEIAKKERQGEPGGRAAKFWLTQQIENRQIRLVSDREKRDRYGRKLAHLFTANGTHINLQLVKLGLAVANIHPPNLKYEKELLRAQSKAEDHRLGLWRTPEYRPVPIVTLEKRRLKGWRRFTGTAKKITKSRKFTRLHFSDNINVRIPNDNLYLFGNLSRYKQVPLEIRGWPSRYRGRTSVLVRHPSGLITKR